MRRLALLVTAGTLWLFLAAIPAFADGGPHIASVNSGTSTLTADSCAGCHRAHTAQGEALLIASDANDLCLDCHSNTGTGASVDVESGVQYALTAGARTGTTVGYLRNGGYVYAHLGTSDAISDPATAPNGQIVRVGYNRATDTVSFRMKVPATTTADVVTSAHLDLDGGGGVVAKNKVWGNGDINAAAPTVTLECVSCHNPHGNGQYRMLNKLPGLTESGFVSPVVYTINNAYAQTDRIFTTHTHGFIVGDIVTITGLSGLTPSVPDGQYVIKSVPSGDSFTIAAATTKTSADVTNAAIDILTGSTSLTGTVKRFTLLVDDAPVPTIAGDERNYTIQQVRGYQGTPSTYLLYVSSLTAAAGGSFPLTADIVGTSNSVTISNYPTFGTNTAYSNVLTTGLAHGFAVGDTVAIAGLGSPADGNYVVASIPSSNTFTLSTVTFGGPTTAGATQGAKLGTATKSVAGTFGSTAGDYFHRTVPWNPAVINPSANCNTYNPPVLPAIADAAINSACLTANDAPNGRPATVTSKVSVNGGSNNVIPSAYGQVAFNDQVSAWCSGCHTRYYSNTNPNPTNLPSATIDVARNIASVSTTTITVTTTAADATFITSTGFAVGDRVTFSAGAPGNVYYVVSASNLTFKVATTFDGTAVSTGFGSGTVIRLSPGSASSWYLPRPGDTTYKYQHQTTTNRSCVTCHVGHGSNALMPGTNSGTLGYPDGTTAYTAGFNSRMLKIDNRGTCQACHDPTGTATAGTTLGNPGAVTVP